MLLPALAAWCAITATPRCAAGESRPGYRSPSSVAFSPDGRLVAVSDATAGALVLLDAQSGDVAHEVSLEGRPAGVAWSAEGKTVFVAERLAGTVAEVRREGKLLRRLRVGPWPTGLVLAPQRGWLLVSDAALDEVRAVELAGGRTVGRVKVSRAPCFLAIPPDERIAVVTNRLPAGDASDPKAAAVISLVDLGHMRVAAELRLAPNATNVLGVAVSPEGRWAYVVHNLARATLPTEMIELGWINANALSVVDLRRKRLHATLLLDRKTEGAANPRNVAVSPDGKRLWVTLSGVHQLAAVDLGRLHAALAKYTAEQKPAVGDTDGEGDESPLAYGAQVFSETARFYADDPASMEMVVSPTPPAYGQGVFFPGLQTRVKLPGNGPRGLAVSPDGRQLAVAEYFSGTVSLVDAERGVVRKTIAPGRQPPADAVRRGETIFHDATRCYQQWLACATCHPDGRADGLNWDLLNDGVGNPKNTRSLVLSGQRSPVMSLGVRASMESAVEAGFEHLLFRPAPPAEREAVEAYLRQLRPAENPFRAGGRLSPSADRGERLFADRVVGCARCHAGPLGTDLGAHNVGTRASFDRDDRLYTPALVEIWRTAPYLHHGKAATLRDVLVKFNPDDRHGRTAQLSPEQLDDLAEYLKSL
jgi:DNA-binding beta-propeller fold protein YncE